jgi:hypothetical protein
MPTSTDTGKKIAQEMHAITDKAVNGANPGDIFQALESMFVFWLSFLSDSDREEAVRELQQHIPQILKDANGFAAVIANSDGVPTFYRQ